MQLDNGSLGALFRGMLYRKPLSSEACSIPLPRLWLSKPNWGLTSTTLLRSASDASFRRGTKPMRVPRFLFVRRGPR